MVCDFTITKFNSTVDANKKISNNVFTLFAIAFVKAVVAQLEYLAPSEFLKSKDLL